MAKLRAVGNRLLLGDEELRGHIGFNSFYPFEKAHTTGATNWQQVIDHAAAAGAKVLRVPIAPRFKNNLQSFVWTYSAPNWTLRASYITLVNQILDYAQSKGVSLLVVPLWRRADPGDIVGQAVGTLGTPGSLALDYVNQILTQMVTQFGSHPALCGWCITNEMDLAAWGGGQLPDINVPLGTPASYTNPQDVTWFPVIEMFLKRAAVAIRAVDPEAFLIAGHGGPLVSGTHARFFVGPTVEYRFPRVLDALDSHPYMSSEGHDTTEESFEYLARLFMGMDRGRRPFILSEFGARISGDTQAWRNDPDGSQSRKMYSAYRRAGIPLMLEWQLCPAAEDSEWGIWPGETRGNQRLDTIKALNTQLAGGPRAARFPVYVRPAQDKCLRVTAASDGFVTVPHSAVYKNSAPFAFCAWIRALDGTPSTFRRPIDCSAGTPPTGFRFVQQATTARSEFGQIYPGILLDNSGTAVDWNGSGGFRLPWPEWTHHAYVWDGVGARCYIDGIAYQGYNKPAGPYPFNHNTNPLGIGQIVGGPYNWNGMIADLQIYNVVLWHADVQKIIAGGSVPGLVGRWKLDGDANDSSGYGNHGVAGAAVQWVDVDAATRMRRA